MTYFAISLVNVLTELLVRKQENVHILGCKTLANFINSQVGHDNQTCSVLFRLRYAIGFNSPIFESTIYDVLVYILCSDLPKPEKMHQARAGLACKTRVGSA
jgi:hypothetical protein